MASMTKNVKKIGDITFVNTRCIARKFPKFRMNTSAKDESH